MDKQTDKKKIQRDRVKKYFLDATIHIIKEEGLENLTTKKIGDRAGYSYATIYNYYENFNELICIAMIQIADDCAAYILENLKGENLVDVCCSFVDLLVDYNAVNPNVYFPFLSTTVDFSYFENENQTHFIHPAYNIILEQIAASEEFKNVDKEELLTIMDISASIFHSALHFYIILKNPKTVEELKVIIKKQIIFLLNRYL